jgi:hypothetical protein
MPTVLCPRCGYMVNRASNAFGKDRPEPGDYTLCLNCGCWLQLSEAMTLKFAPDMEALAGLSPRRLAKAQALATLLRLRGRLHGPGTRH